MLITFPPVICLHATIFWLRSQKTDSKMETCVLLGRLSVREWREQEWAETGWTETPHNRGLSQSHKESWSWDGPSYSSQTEARGPVLHSLELTVSVYVLPPGKGTRPRMRQLLSAARSSPEQRPSTTVPWQARWWAARIFKTCTAWLFIQVHRPHFPESVKLKKWQQITIAVRCE